MKPTKWTKEAIQEEALKYDSRTEFLKGSVGAYARARKTGILEEVCSHMACKRFKYTGQEIIEAAKPYKTKADWERNDPNMARLAYKRGVIEEATKHMTNGNFLYTEKEVVAEARKYKTRRDFKLANRNLYQVALRRVPEAFDHMTYGGCGFSKDNPAILYLLKIFSTTYGEIYKVGVTNRTVETRFSPSELSNISVLETVEFSVGVQALELERYILNKYKQFKFQGDPLLLSGNTELLTVRPSLCGPKET